MGRPSLVDAIREETLICDGAMGTQLQLAGLEPGGCGEAWNLERPEAVLRIQRAYVEAGSDCLITNTFGASRIMLERHGRGALAAAINAAGVRIAREAFGGRHGWVLGDMGPFGGLMEPYGDVPEGRVRDAFREQAAALVEAGADAVIVETQTSLEELGIAVEAALAAGAACVIGSFAYDVTRDETDLKTMMGVGPEEAARFLERAGAHVAALNCGSGVDVRWAARVVERYREACSLPAMAQPNAGAPVLEGGRVVYKQTPEQMAADLPELLRTGVRIVGACCGSTPAHIGRLREAVEAAGRGGAP
ncbi:MAG: homocysteine S-methyltransferase family protein [Planctomycetes bacterium]|nr:homocysteine S-methyltransferase family protein [Planctomycetota bacterium]